jgi:hypothetical protein
MVPSSRSTKVRLHRQGAGRVNRCYQEPPVRRRGCLAGPSVLACRIAQAHHGRALAVGQPLPAVTPSSTDAGRSPARLSHEQYYHRDAGGTGCHQQEPS